MTGRRQQLSGWGRFPQESCSVARPESQRALSQHMTQVPQVIARGMGRSYGDPAIDPHALVVDQTGLNRMLAFDEDIGVLECEAGVRFDEIIAAFLPRGWFLPTTPGTKFVTVGGAIAADVHGKNHHRVGSVGNAIESITLLLASGDLVECSPDIRADLFYATLGGMGLTGVIRSARMRLIRVPSAYCRVDYHRTRDLDQTLDQFGATDNDYEYSVAWIDCLARGRKLGRSVLMLGNGAAAEELPRASRGRPYELPARKSKTVPKLFPSSLLNRATIRAFNAMYYRIPRRSSDIVDFDSYFYPLDSLHHWNRMYGRRGFIQYQAWFPRSTSRQGLVDLLERIAASGRGSFLAVLKSCGDATGGLLSFLDRGHTLALDFANSGADLLKLTRSLDDIVLRHGGRLYLAKDAMMSAGTFAAMYPQLPEFRRIQASADPDGRFVSSQARRLQILESAGREPQSALTSPVPEVASLGAR